MCIISRSIIITSSTIITSIPISISNSVIIISIIVIIMDIIMFMMYVQDDRAAVPLRGRVQPRRARDHEGDCYH